MGDSHVTALPLQCQAMSKAGPSCHCAGSDPTMHLHTVPLGHDAAVYTSNTNPARQQSNLSTLPPAPPLSMGSFGQHLPQHQVITLFIIFAHILCTAGVGLQAGRGY